MDYEALPLTGTLSRSYGLKVASKANRGSKCGKGDARYYKRGKTKPRYKDHNSERN